MINTISFDILTFTLTILITDPSNRSLTLVIKSWPRPWAHEDAQIKVPYNRRPDISFKNNHYFFFRKFLWSIPFRLTFLIILLQHYLMTDPLNRSFTLIIKSWPKTWAHEDGRIKVIKELQFPLETITTSSFVIFYDQSHFNWPFEFYFKNFYCLSHHFG